MTPGARLAAASEVLHEILTRKAAADRVLQQWGKAHRFAGSKDRANIAERVYAILRRLGECAAAMGGMEPRALVIGSLNVVDGLAIEAIEALCVDGAHALGPLTTNERQMLLKHEPARGPAAHVNCPSWLLPELEQVFGETTSAELDALNERAPFDLRVNLLKATREEVLTELKKSGLPASPCPFSVTGIRIAAGGNPKIETYPCFLEGRVEVQDESSQLAVAFADAKPDDIVVDLAAGGGGKSLALAAAMQNRGQIFACDVDAARLKHMMPRMARAGDGIIQLSGDPYADALPRLFPNGADLVFVDAPCSGSGTWRRNPEAKWTLSEETLQRYQDAQVSLLNRAVQLVKPHGRIVFAVCSLLMREGREQVDAFCARSPGWVMTRHMFLTPLQSGSDGFFAAELCRRTL